MKKFHVTLEQGGTTFKDDQQVFTSTQNFGNNTTPILGQQMYLNDLTQAYGVRGDSIYSKVLLTANPTPWLDVFGEFLYSRPDDDRELFAIQRGTVRGSGVRCCFIPANWTC